MPLVCSRRRALASLGRDLALLASRWFGILRYAMGLQHTGVHAEQLHVRHILSARPRASICSSSDAHFSSSVAPFGSSGTPSNCPARAATQST